MRTFREVDVSPIEAAVHAGSANMFARVADEVGIELTLNDFVSYATRFIDAASLPKLAREVFKLVDAATFDTSARGFGLVQHAGLTVLVVRVDARIVIGLQPSSATGKPFPKKGWLIGKWYKDADRTRPAAEAWANDAARGSDALTVKSAPAALRAAVTAEPESMEARLAYAAWLSAHDDARGDFIRVQCEIERLRADRIQNVEDADDDDDDDDNDDDDDDDDDAGEGDDGDLARLSKQSTQLSAEVEGDIREAVAAFTEHASMVRGLIGRVTIRVAKLAKHGAHLVKEHPIVAMRILCNGADEFAQLGAMPFLAGVAYIEIESRRTPKITHSRAVMKPTALANHPLFARTKSLELSDFADDRDEWVRFFSKLHAPHLEEIRLVRLELDRPAYEALANASGLQRLRVVDVVSPALKRAEAEDIVAAVKRMAKRTLTDYRFSSWQPGDATMARCVTAMLACPTLTRLRIENCSAGTETMAAIAAHGVRLKHLALVRGAPTIGDMVPAIAPLKALRSITIESAGWADKIRQQDIEAMIDCLLAAPQLAVVRWWNVKLSAAQRRRLQTKLRLSAR